MTGPTCLSCARLFRGCIAPAGSSEVPRLASLQHSIAGIVPRPCSCSAPRSTSTLPRFPHAAAISLRCVSLPPPPGASRRCRRASAPPPRRPPADSCAHAVGMLCEGHGPAVSISSAAGTSAQQRRRHVRYREAAVVTASAQSLWGLSLVAAVQTLEASGEVLHELEVLLDDAAGHSLWRLGLAGRSAPGGRVLWLRGRIGLRQAGNACRPPARALRTSGGPALGSSRPGRRALAAIPAGCLRNPFTHRSL